MLNCPRPGCKGQLVYKDSKVYECLLCDRPFVKTAYGLVPLNQVANTFKVQRYQSLKGH